MAYDKKLEERIQEKLKGTRGLIEKKMFGGVGFMISRQYGLWHIER